MYKFKNSLIAFSGLAALAVATPLLIPLIGFGSNAASANAPTSQTQNVNVVNTPTVSAQQNGTWNVGINGTPTVGIDGGNNTVKIDSANPVPVRDVDNPARQPFTYSNSGFWTGNAPNLFFSFTIPAGKRLVIEQVSAYALLTSSLSQKLRISVSAQCGGVGILYPIGTFETGPQGYRTEFAGGSQVKMYADDGATIGLTRNDTNGLQDQASVFLSGYLVDL